MKVISLQLANQLILIKIIKMELCLQTDLKQIKYPEKSNKLKPIFENIKINLFGMLFFTIFFFNEFTNNFNLLNQFMPATFISHH